MALAVAMDANRYVAPCKGEQHALRAVQDAQQIIMPFIVLAELRAGFRSGGRAQANERTLPRFLQAPRVSLIFANEATTHFYATLFADLRAAGTPIPTNDLWIASLILQHDLVLFSRDKHFDAIPRIPRI